MAINVSEERLVTFAELARALPHRRGNRPIHISTLHRWRSRGLSGGVKLEAVRVGGAWHTSWEAFRRFCDRLTTAHQSSSTDRPFPKSRLENEEADASLHRDGW